MITMTLHAVTVECETLAQALCLLNEWARMGRIELPPAPRDLDRQAAPAPVPAPSTFPRRCPDCHPSGEKL